MKLVRSGPAGQETPGLLDAALAKLRLIDPLSLPLVTGQPRLGGPVAGVGKFIAIGLNYSDHAAETGAPTPTEPIVFMKATSCILGPNDPVTPSPPARRLASGWA